MIIITKKSDNIKVNMPDGVNYIISKLYDNGYEAYAVGGCIRDSIMGKDPKDWDITTSAKPDSIMEIFKGNRTIPTGLRHGTVTVLAGNDSYEVTTYRIDGDYADGRHPEYVVFTDSLKEDLSRRDFTINAMAYNHREGLVDCFNGKGDLMNNIIRCVGDADMRFSEDYLRMLRAYRFAAALGFDLEKSLLDSCMNNKEKILNISAERIRSEIDKIFTSDNFKIAKKFLDDFSDILLPELYALKGLTQNNKYHFLDVYDHTLEVFKNTPCESDMRLTALFHDIGKRRTKSTDSGGVDHFHGHQKISAEMAFNIMKRLKYDNKTTSCVIDLVNTHDDRLKPDKKPLRKLISKLGEIKAYKNLQFQYADVMGQSSFSKEVNLPVLDKCFRLYNEIIADKDACTIKDLAVSGTDVINALNLKQGELVGEVLNFLLENVIDNPDLNNKDKLIDLMHYKYCLNNKN